MPPPPVKPKPPQPCHGYLDTNLAAYRYQAAGLVWLDQRIDDSPRHADRLTSVPFTTPEAPPLHDES